MSATSDNQQKPTEKGIPCPKCHHCQTRVIRTAAERGYVWRRRRCSCGFRFTTFERTPGAKVPLDVSVSIGRLREMSTLLDSVLDNIRHN